MNNYTALKIFLLILLIITLSSTVTAYTPNWKVDFNNNLAGYSDNFIAGAGSPATDGYDVTDLRQPPSAPSGVYIQIISTADANALTEEYKADLEDGIKKTWKIKLIAMDPQYQGISGLNKITWSLENTENINLQLIDYGKDSTQTNIIDTINLKEQSSYDFNIDNALGPYRYLDLVAEKIGSTQESEPPEEEPDEEEPPPMQPSKKKKESSSKSCTPEWTCSEWSKCVNNKRTRICVDENRCKSDRSKPFEIEYCASQTEDNKPKETTKTTPKTTRRSDSTRITGAAATEIPLEASLFIGFSIIIIIVGLGLAIFFLLTRR